VIAVPEEYVVQKFYQFCGAPSQNRHNKTFQGSCPICREGKSWLKKRRCYYIPKNNNIFCHNCGWSGTPVSWIMQVGRISFHDIKGELDNMDQHTVIEPVHVKPAVQSDTLPKDSINLMDPTQVEYYHTNVVVQRALEFIKSRRLDTAINRPNAFYVSLNDKVHNNRLIIPFVDAGGKIVHYQSRTILKADEKVRPRYMSKQGSEKTLFNFDKIDANVDTIFVFEGPLNACFCKNSVAVAGIQDNSDNTFTTKQQEQMQRLPLHSHVWVLDSQWIDTAALNKSKILAASGESVFIWPEHIGKKIKDFNDLAVIGKIDQVSPEFIAANTFRGMSAEIRLRAIC
jgi:hypothetical protein